MVIAQHVRSWRKLFPTVGCHRRLRKDFTGQPDASAELQPVVLMRHVIEAHTRQAFRPTVPQSHPAPAFGPLGTHMDLVAVATRQRFAVIGNGQRQKMELNVGIDNARAASNMTATFKMVGGTQTAMGEQPFGANLGFAKQSNVLIQANRLRAFLLDVQLQMIHQVFTNTRAVLQHFNSVIAQFLLRSDA